MVVNSPLYWILQEYRDTKGQLGYLSDYASFLGKLNTVWAQCSCALVPGSPFSASLGTYASHGHGGRTTGTTWLGGILVSTTHTINGATVGVGYS
jgi:hypothetical protein